MQALEDMLNAETEESRQCCCLAIANIAANDYDNELELSLAEGILRGKSHDRLAAK